MQPLTPRASRATKYLQLLSLTLLAAPVGASAQAPRVQVELEAGPAWQSYNDVEIPNDGTATRFSLSGISGPGAYVARRLYVGWRIAAGHELRLLVAPFSLTETGISGAPLSFAGASYSGGQPVQASYTFNSYRLSYRWLARSGQRFSAWLGLTAKVRDAEIALEQGSTSSRKDDLGFVPLLHLSGGWRPASRWSFSLDADGLAGGPGRAIDASLKIGYDLSDRWAVRAGYRTLEGGADVEEVYNFAWLNYATASVILRW